MSLLDNPVVRVPRLPIPPMLRGSPQVTQLSNDGSLSCGSGRCQRSGGCDLSENDKNRKFSIHLQRLDGASGFGVNGGDVCGWGCLETISMASGRSDTCGMWDQKL